jgi:DNA-binding winged helix-turn-helix (wHTH) protein
VAAQSSSNQKSGTARFGIFEADLTARELRKQGRRIRLQDQPFSVLALLIERAGDVVTREELRERLWTADTFVDFDHSLNTAVNKIREVLGDSAGSPRFVETVARRGYRFLGDVKWDSGSAASAQSHPGIIERTIATREFELPASSRGITRLLFGLIQLMYLIFYVEALLHWQGVDQISWSDAHGPLVLIVVLVTASAGIPVRFYLLSAAAFDYLHLGVKFHKIFLPLLVLDELWAIAPFLILPQIGFGACFAATAALLYVPFAERTLIRMAYPRTAPAVPAMVAK